MPTRRLSTGTNLFKLSDMIPTIKEYIGEAYYDREGQMIFAKHGENLQQLVDVRGWGHLSNLFRKEGLTDNEAAKFQDQIGEFVTQAINEKLNPVRFKMVSDQSCHDYVIPVDKSKEWREFMELPDDDPRSWDVPDFARSVQGRLTFADPQVD